MSENIYNEQEEEEEEEPLRDYYSCGTCAAHPFQWSNPANDGALEDFDVALEIEKLDVSKPGWPPKKCVLDQQKYNLEGVTFSMTVVVIR